MGNLIGLKNMLMFSAVLLTIGSVSAQQAFAGSPSCFSIDDGNWNDKNNWEDCDGGTPDVNTDANIEFNDIIITGIEEAIVLDVRGSGTLFIDCDASLNLFGGQVSQNSNITNHGTFDAVRSLFLSPSSNFFNSGDSSNVVEDGGSFVKIDSICDQPIGGTVGSLDTATLLVAGAQANMGWWSLALVGIVGAAAAITYKVKSKKTEQ